MITEDIKVYIDERPEFFDKILIYIVLVRLDKNKKYMGKFNSDGTLDFSKETPEGIYSDIEPTMSIPKSILQLVIDGLGSKIPPTKEVANEAELKATRYHLEDMRKIVFDFKKMIEVKPIENLTLSKND